MDNFLFLYIFLISIPNIYQCFSRVSHQHRDPVLLISLDGIQANVFDQYLKNNPDSSFNEIIRTGVKADYMIPSFPTG
jgi:predicted AlkP superfamily pyrophosphatase or phosphodiesterase